MDIILKGDGGSFDTNGMSAHVLVRRVLGRQYNGHVCDCNFFMSWISPFVSSVHNNDRIKTNLEQLLPYPVEESRDNPTYFFTIPWFLGSRILVWTFLEVLF